MKINRFVRYSFSKLYDIIAIGPYANRIAKTVSQHCSQSLSILTVEEQNTLMEPALMPVGETQIRLKQGNQRFSDIELGVGVAEINPNSEYIVLNNGQKYSYRNLIYSGNPEDWKQEQLASNSSKSFKDSYSFIYDDFNFSNIQELFARRSGSIVFTIPKDVHFGYQNYFMMLLSSRIKQKRTKAPFPLEPISISVVCEGSSLTPFNQALSRLLQYYLKLSKIKVFKNKPYSIDYPKRKILIKGSKQQVKFDSLFNYCARKCPNILSKSNIDPFQNNRHLLNNSKFQNVFIVGNIVNNVYSFSALNSMSKIVAHNVLNRCLGINKRAIYKGDTAINLWLSDSYCHHVQMDYDGERFKQDYGKSKIINKAVSMANSKYLVKNVNKYINSGCGLYSNFDGLQFLSTQKFQVPAIIQNQLLYT